MFVLVEIYDNKQDKKNVYNCFWFYFHVHRILFIHSFTHSCNPHKTPANEHLSMQCDTARWDVNPGTSDSFPAVTACSIFHSFIQLKTYVLIISYIPTHRRMLETQWWTDKFSGLSDLNVCEEDKSLRFIHILFFAAQKMKVSDMSSLKWPSPLLKGYLHPFHLHFSPFHLRGRKSHPLLLDLLPTAKTCSDPMYSQHFWELFLSRMASLSLIFSISFSTDYSLWPESSKIIFFLIFWSYILLKLLLSLCPQQ